MGAFDSLLNMGGEIFGALKIVLMLSPFVIFFIVVGVKLYYKYRYIYKVRMFKIREHGLVKEANYTAAYISRKNSGFFFRIRTGKWWWQHLDLVTTPKVDSADIDNRFYYLQKDVMSYIQLGRKVDNEKTYFVPLSNQDIRYSAILRGKKIRRLLMVESTLSKLLPYLALLVFAIIYVVAYIFALRQGGVVA